MINKDYLYTELWDDLDSVRLKANSMYFYARDVESRSGYCAPILQSNNSQTQFIQIKLLEEDMLWIVDSGSIISLNDQNAVRGFLEARTAKIVYIDVTGMSCRIVAPFLLVGINMGLAMHVIYTEPNAYKIKEFKKDGFNKDLSERVSGINPLPGLAKLVPPKQEPLFVVLLGFEGGRFTYLSGEVSASKIRPIIGVPGYRPHYPFVSYLGNKYSILRTKCWRSVQYAEANSIVDAYATLTQIYESNKKTDIIVAPIGTKPHAIAAILFAIKHSERVELVYDNPYRHVLRTEGIGHVLSCNVSKLIAEI